jgi:hypothetical protein
VGIIPGLHGQEYQVSNGTVLLPEPTIIEDYFYKQKILINETCLSTAAQKKK